MLHLSSAIDSRLPGIPASAFYPRFACYLVFLALIFSFHLLRSSSCLLPFASTSYLLPPTLHLRFSVLVLRLLLFFFGFLALALSRRVAITFPMHYTFGLRHTRLSSAASCCLFVVIVFEHSPTALFPVCPCSALCIHTSSHLHNLLHYDST